MPKPVIPCNHSAYKNMAKHIVLILVPIRSVYCCRRMDHMMHSSQSQELVIQAVNVLASC